MDFIRNFMKASLHNRVRRSVTFMTMINKEKVLKGVGKAVDAANNAAAFAKEKELDKKAKNMAHTLEDGIKSAGESLENLFKN